jgi:hypothetical protein
LSFVKDRKSSQIGKISFEEGAKRHFSQRFGIYAGVVLAALLLIKNIQMP